jgi:ribosomal protein S18 acetylase RimI-like enzyme
MLHVEAARPEDRRAALQVLLRELPPAVREQQVGETLDAAARGEVSLDGLLVARADADFAGAVLFVMQPDGCAFVWPPVVSDADLDGPSASQPSRDADLAGPSASQPSRDADLDGPSASQPSRDADLDGPSASQPSRDVDFAETVADALLQGVCRRLDETGAWLGQCLLEPENERDAGRLLRNGFEFLADLTYLRRPLDRNVRSVPDSPLIAETVDPEVDAARLGGVIERTYSGSTDCPQINGLRTGLEAVTGHRSTGLPLRDGWMIFRDSRGDVGVLLLADQPEQDACELVYMGVVPEARGRGYGREIVEAAVRRAAKTARRGLLLAVDERNRFAGTIYESAGFEFLDRKRVFARRPRAETKK